MKARVQVTLKAGILDPQGKAICQALQALGVPGLELEVAEVAKIAQALKSLAIYDALAHDHDDDPEGLQELVQEGLDAVEKMFDC